LGSVRVGRLSELLGWGLLRRERGLIVFDEKEAALLRRRGLRGRDFDMRVVLLKPRAEDLKGVGKVVHS
jgi:hypothetical protein